MTEFSTEAQLKMSADRSSARGLKKTLESELSNVKVGLETGGTTARRMNSGSGGGLGSSAASTAVGTKLSGMSGSLEETLALDEERNTVLSELLEATERNAGGGGSGGGSISSLITLGGISSMLGGGGLASMISTVSLSSLVSKVSFKSLLKKTPALATLVTAASLTDDLINGTLGPDDLVDSAIGLGELMTFEMLGNDLIEGAIGTVTLSYGTIQIANLIGGTLGSSTLLSMFGGAGSLGIGSVLGGSVGSSTLVSMLGGTGAIGIGSVLAPLAAGGLAGYLGSVGIEKLIDMHEGAEGYDQEVSKTSAGTDAAQQGGVDFDSLEGVDAPEVENPRGHIPASEAATGVRSVDSNPHGVGDGSSSDDSGSDGGSGGNGSASQPARNQARENTSKPAQLNYTSTINADVSRLERKIDEDLREFKRRLTKLERAIDGSR